MSLEERVKYASMKARHRKALLPWYKKPSGVILIFLGILFLIPFSIYAITTISYLQDMKQPPNTQEEYLQEAANRINRPTYLTFGAVDAPLTIVQFADYACPYCANSHQGVKYIKDNHLDKVKLVIRDLPLHDNSVFLAIAARCAREQGEDKFWDIYSLFYQNQTAFDKSLAELRLGMPDIATALGMNETSFVDCLDKEKYFNQVEQDANDAEFLKLEGTPTWLFNGVYMIGELTEPEIEELITNFNF